MTPVRESEARPPSTPPDRFRYLLKGLLACLTRCHTAGQIGHVGAVVVSCFFNHDRILPSSVPPLFHLLSILRMLLKSELKGPLNTIIAAPDTHQTRKPIIRIFLLSSEFKESGPYRSINQVMPAPTAPMTQIRMLRISRQLCPTDLPWRVPIIGPRNGEKQSIRTVVAGRPM